MEGAPGTGAVHRYFRGIPDARRTPADLRCVARQPAHLRRWWRHVAQFGDPARERSRGYPRSPPARNIPEVAYAAYSNLDGRNFGVAKTTDAGRIGRWCGRKRPPSPLPMCTMAGSRATRPKLGRHTAESRSRAHRSEYRLRHRSGADHAFHRRRQELERRVFQEGIGRRRYLRREWTSLLRTASTSTRSTRSASSSPTPTSACSAARMAAKAGSARR